VKRRTGVHPKIWIEKLFDECLLHDGYASIRVEMRILKRGQKEVIVDCGKQYRFVLDFPPEQSEEAM
jgi:hypothetical protein